MQFNQKQGIEITILQWKLEQERKEKELLRENLRTQVIAYRSDNVKLLKSQHN